LKIYFPEQKKHPILQSNFTIQFVLQHSPRLEVTHSNKPSSLLSCRFNYGREKF